MDLSTISLPPHTSMHCMTRVDASIMAICKDRQKTQWQPNKNFFFLHQLRLLCVDVDNGVHRIAPSLNRLSRSLTRVARRNQRGIFPRSRDGHGSHRSAGANWVARRIGDALSRHKGHFQVPARQLTPPACERDQRVTTAFRSFVQLVYRPSRRAKGETLCLLLPNRFAKRLTI